MGAIVEGGRYRRPGPNLRGTEGLDEIGKTSDGISSPGNTTVCVAIPGFNMKI